MARNKAPTIGCNGFNMVDEKDIQGLLKRGFGHLPQGLYVLLQISNPPAMKSWLQAHMDKVTTAAEDKPSQAINIAFTCSGLKKLQLPASVLQSFSREWQESMITPERSCRLGDIQHNAPENWEWGDSHHSQIDLLLCGFHETHKKSQRWLQDLEQQPFLQIVHTLNCNSLPNNKEHFGFRDGISQPAIKNLHAGKAALNSIATGEFILGHRNEYDEVDFGPTIATKHDKHLLLKSNKKGISYLGLNGSYLVFRQLEQDVKAFWQYADEQSKDEYNKSHPQSRLLFASKMVGRWPNGKRIRAGATAQPSSGIAHKPENNFTYERDQAGLGCPIGSHIRRANPRGTLSGQKKIKDAIKTSNRHRILRRGRSYGAPLSSTMTPEAFLQAKDNDEKRGLLFICLNADIARQFEFVQQTWLNNNKFRGLYDEVDPIAGIKPKSQQALGNHFSIPGKPFRQRLRQVPPFVTVKGGGYFFLPSISALKFLSTLADEPSE